MQTNEQVKDTHKPSFYKPVTLSTIAGLTNAYAWLNLVIAVLYPIFMLATLDNRLKDNLAPMALSVGHWWEWHNLTSSYLLMQILPTIIINCLSLIGAFFLFKSVSIGLNVLLEIDFNVKTEAEGEQNE